MSANRKIIPPEVLLESYQRNAGNITATAKELGADRNTVRKCLALYGADKKPVTGGSVKPLKHNVMPLPEKGKVKRYLLSSAQNNTKVFGPFLDNLEAYRDWLGDCEIMISRFTYNKSAFQNKRSKPGKQSTSLEQDLWFDPSIEAYICDDPERHGTCRWRLAPDLWFAAEMQIEATNEKPLSSLKTYTGTASTIFPHTRVSMEAVPTLICKQTPYVKHLYTTGTVTGRNYIQRKAGLKAEFHHTFACLLVEVDHTGSWWCRQVIADGKGNFYDCPNGIVVKVSGGEVSAEGHSLEAINWGDVHVTDMPAERLERYWGNNNSVIDILKPRYQFFHDTLSFRSRSHHEMKSFSAMLEKHYMGQESVEEELKKTIGFLGMSERADTMSVVVRSNHDEHGSVWLDTADYKADYPNAEVFLEAQLDRVRAIKRGERKEWMFLKWAAEKYGAPETIHFLKAGESFVICEKSGHPIECSLHGDKGPNGSRGSTANLSTLGCKTNKGHDHSATIKEGVYSAGTCAENQGYNEGNGATTWSISHIFTYVNGKRCITTERKGKLWA